MYLPGPGGYLPGPGGGTCLVPGGAGVPAWSQRGVYLPGPRGGVPAWSRGGVPTWSWGVYLPGPRGAVPGQVLPPLWTEFLTHASENFTLPQTSFAGGNDAASVSSFQVEFLY